MRLKETLLALSALAAIGTAPAVAAGNIGTFRADTTQTLAAPAFVADDGTTIGEIKGDEATFTLQASSGIAADPSVRFKKVGGTLPPGATLAEDGSVHVPSGSTTDATYEFTVKAVNAAGLSATHAFRIASIERVQLPLASATPLQQLTTTDLIVHDDGSVDSVVRPSDIASLLADSASTTPRFTMQYGGHVDLFYAEPVRFSKIYYMTKATFAGSIKVQNADDTWQTVASISASGTTGSVQNVVDLGHEVTTDHVMVTSTVGGTLLYHLRFE